MNERRIAITFTVSLYRNARAFIFFLSFPDRHCLCALLRRLHSDTLIADRDSRERGAGRGGGGGEGEGRAKVSMEKHFCDRSVSIAWPNWPLRATRLRLPNPLFAGARVQVFGPGRTYGIGMQR